MGHPTPFPTPSLQPDATQVGSGFRPLNISRLTPLAFVSCVGCAFCAVEQHMGHQLHHVVSVCFVSRARMSCLFMPHACASRYPYKDQDASSLFRFDITSGKC